MPRRRRSRNQKPAFNRQAAIAFVLEHKPQFKGRIDSWGDKAIKKHYDLIFSQFTIN